MSSTFKFNTFREKGQSGSDVKKLQQTLNKFGFTVAKSGAGSFGNETNFFGDRTTAALKQFQSKVGLESDGRFGPKTRAALNSYKLPDPEIKGQRLDTKLPNPLPGEALFKRGTIKEFDDRVREIENLNRRQQEGVRDFQQRFITSLAPSERERQLRVASERENELQGQINSINNKVLSDVDLLSDTASSRDRTLDQLGLRQSRAISTGSRLARPLIDEFDTLNSNRLEELQILQADRQAESEQLKAAIGFTNDQFRADKETLQQINQLRGEQKEQAISDLNTVLESFKGLSYDELSPEAQSSINELIAYSPLSIDSVRNSLANQKAEFAEEELIRSLTLRSMEADAEAEDAAQAAFESGFLSDEQFKTARELADFYKKQNPDFFDQKSAYEKVIASADDPSAAGDISLIIAYMKMLDPGSVVREGEFATAAAAAGLGQRIQNIFKKVDTGERLTQAQRDDFIRQAGNIFETSLNNQKEIRSRAESLGLRAGLPSDAIADILGNLETINIRRESQSSEITDTINVIPDLLNSTDQQTSALSTDSLRLDFNQAPTANNSGAPIEATRLIFEEEGFRSEAYQDATGTWTIGYGTTRINGQPVQPGMRISKEDAAAIANKQIEEQYSSWKKFINRSLTAGQQAALYSFTYNLGAGIWLQKGAKSIIDSINKGDMQSAGKQMQKYVYSKGQKLPGLVKRRKNEAQLLLT